MSPKKEDYAVKGFSQIQNRRCIFFTTILKLTGLRKAQKASATRWCQDASSSLCGCDNLALYCIGVQFCKCASGMEKHRRNWTGENGR